MAVVSKSDHVAASFFFFDKHVAAAWLHIMSTSQS